MQMPTIIESILSKASGKKCGAGDRIWADVNLAAIRDFGGPNVILKYRERFNNSPVHDPEKIAITFDLHIPAKTEKVAQNQQLCREFAKEQGIKVFDIECGIGQLTLLENGWLKPGQVVVGTDSHMNLLGAAGVFATGVGTTDIVAAWKYEKLWYRVPETHLFNVEGKLGKRVSAKDVILHILKEVGEDGLLYKAVEFSGKTIENMELYQRITLASMVTEMSGKIGFFPVDEKVINFLNDRVEGKILPIEPENPTYEKERNFDIGGLEPQVAVPHSPANVKPVSEVEGIELDQVFIGSCTNGRFEDFENAAEIIGKNEVANGTRFIIVPGTREVALRLLESGLHKIFVDAGGVVTNPSCSLCTMGHPGVLAPGEVTLSTSNRNFPGKIGKGGKVYLSSPETAAASAITGEITDPRSI